MAREALLFLAWLAPLLAFPTAAPVEYDSITEEDYMTGMSKELVSFTLLPANVFSQQPHSYPLSHTPQIPTVGDGLQREEGKFYGRCLDIGFLACSFVKYNVCQKN
ncbi:unnamed protein product [Bubo scandiacus]